MWGDTKKVYIRNARFFSIKIFYIKNSMKRFKLYISLALENTVLAALNHIRVVSPNKVNHVTFMRW